MFKFHTARLTRPLRRMTMAATFAIGFGTAHMVMTPSTAQAACCEATTCACMTAVATGVINPHTTSEIQAHQIWMVETYFKSHLLPSMMKMTEQMSAVGMQQMHMLGAFLDAKHLLETQRVYQELAARAHKDYHPSEGLCTIGTTIRSLAASDRHADSVASIMSKRSLSRQLLNVSSSAAGGRGQDRTTRLNQFLSTYCDKNDNGGQLNGICAAGVSPDRANRDIDYGRTIAAPLTLNINFAGGDSTTDEQDVMALAANLYSHDIAGQVPGATLKDNRGNQETYMNLRSIVAKRSVAENSFQAIAAMKSSGASDAAETAKYLAAAMKELGVSDEDAKTMVGANPSYYAQMEILTKRIFQRPEFFIDLYDKPANVARKGVAIQALGLIQDRDIFKSAIRSEALLSVLLELEVVKAQTPLNGEINRMTPTK